MDGLSGLPAELVCNIFRLAIDPVAPREDRCRLILVYRQWREYVECFPLLWTDISATQGMPDSAAELVAFMTEVGPHIARWRSVMVELPRATRDPESALAPLTTAQVPGLEKLTLAGEPDYLRREDTITLFGGAPAPSTLKALTLHRVPVVFELLNLSNLVSLDLVTVSKITTPQLLDILRGSTGLETLKLADNPGMVAIESQATNIQPIELPKFISLSLRTIDNGATHSILSNIRVPNRRSISMNGHIRGVSVRSVLFTSAITHILHTTIPSTDAQSSVIRIEEFYDVWFSIRFRGIELAPFQVNGEDQILEILSWIVDGLGPEAAGCSVHLILDWSETNCVHFVSLPHPLVVKHLSFSFSDSMSESLRKALYVAMVRPPLPTSDGWLFAQLESISVEFVSMLKSRYVGATSTGETDSRCPMNLRSVELRGRPRTEELVEEIRGILPEANVFWVK